jgi:type 1 glutamine amidotransferase
MKPSMVTSVLLLCTVAGSQKDGPALAFEKADSSQIVFLVSEDPANYEATKTIPVFAKMLADRYACRTTVIRGEGEPNAFHFPGLETIKDADVLVIFFRRRALSAEQLGMIRAYLAAGKPLVGLRTANHAFSVRGEVAEGYQKWWEFPPDVLGCGNHGYGPTKPGTDVAVVPEAADHPILAGVKARKWHSNGNLYLVAPIDEKATVLLTGSVGDSTEPIAWTRRYKGSRVFYTSQGHPDDFMLPQFRTMLTNAIFWAMERRPSGKR